MLLKTKLSLTVTALLALPMSIHAETEELATIVVEGGSGRPGSFSLAPDSAALKDTSALLERVPGANINRNGPLTGIPQYRGMFGNRVNVTVDGESIKEAGPNSMDTPLTHIPASLVNSMQVYRGIAPISSGIETIGGSIKVKLKKGHFSEVEDEIESDGVLSSGYSSVENGYFVSGFTSLANQNHKVHIGVSKEEGNDYKYKEREGKKVVPSEYDRQAVTVGYDYQREGHEFGVNYSNNNTINTGTPALPMDIVYIHGNLYDVKYNLDFGQDYQLKTKFFYQSTDHLMDNHSLRSVIQNGKPLLMDNTTNVEAGGWDFSFLMPLFSGTLTTGFNGDTAHHNSNIHMNAVMNSSGMPMDMYTSSFNNATRTRYSFYGEWEGDITEKLSTELGLRVTYLNADTGNVATTITTNKNLAAKFNAQDHNKDFVNVDLAAIFRYAMRSDLDFEVGFARKTRGPSYQELYLWAPLQATGGLADGRTYVGNLDLKSEASYQFEFGMDWHADNAYFSPRAFYHYVHNYIQGNPSDTLFDDEQPKCPTSVSCPVLEYTNINAQLYGVDFDAGYIFTDWVRFDGGLNYVRGQNLSQGGNLYRIAPLNGRTQLTFNYDTFTTSIEGVYYAAQNQVASYNNEQTTKAYQIMNLRASYEPIDGFIIATGIENVLDLTNRNHLGGYYNPPTDTENDITRGQRIPLQGRNYYATLSYNW